MPNGQQQYLACPNSANPPCTASPRPIEADGIGVAVSRTSNVGSIIPSLLCRTFVQSSPLKKRASTAFLTSDAALLPSEMDAVRGSFMYAGRYVVGRVGDVGLVG